MQLVSQLALQNDTTVRQQRCYVCLSLLPTAPQSTSANLPPGKYVSSTEKMIAMQTTLFV